MRHRHGEQPDRRPNRVANQHGYGLTLTVDDLPPWRRGMYDAQLAYWRAACAYEQAIGLNVAYGLHVPAELVWEYDRARANWQPWLLMLTTPPTRPQLTTLPTRKEYL